VKFGVSPKGIWRPGYPRQIRGMDAYAKIYADSRKWLASGWLDYFSPELYWPIEPKEQSFPVLLKWWAEQNSKGRHLWPGIATFRAVGWSPDEISHQVRITRKQPGVTGCIFYSMNSLVKNTALAEALQRDINTQPALVPASPWLDSIPPDKPKLTIGEGRAGWRFQWESSGGEPAWLWVLQFRTNEVWTTEILPANETTRTFFASEPDIVSVSTVDRTGNLSSPAALKKARLVHYGKNTIISN
jgi:hypothetical protein